MSRCASAASASANSAVTGRLTAPSETVRKERSARARSASGADCARSESRSR